MSKPKRAHSASHFYRPKDVRGVDYRKDLGDPGHYPFTRGIYADMYCGSLWTMRQYAGYGDAEESNRRYRYLLSQGVTGLSVAFDLPTQIGMDSDNPAARGEVGRVGVAIDSLDDMERLFQEIPLERISCSMTINATAAVLLALYVALAKRRKLSPECLRGTIQNDILKEYVARGTYIYPPGPSMRIVTDIFAFCKELLPNWNAISISGYHIREAGATAVQEVAFTLANAEAYIEAALSAGLAIDEFAPRISFFFSAHNNFFEEIAKFRAARKLWARMAKEQYGAANHKSWLLRFHTQTAGSTLTAQQPQNNAVRVAYQALAAVLGGTQSLHTNAQDEALALPTEESTRLALRTQQILAYETAVTNTVDPLGGSWYVEKLTKDLEEEAETYLERIRDMGGSLQAIQNGYIQKEIQQSAYEQQLALEKEGQVVVGINRFCEGSQGVLQVLRISPEVERTQIDRLERFRLSRDRNKAERKLDELEKVALTRRNLVPATLAAVEAGATLGEVSGHLRNVFGEHRDSTVF